jgi:hypothetical protein
MKINKKLGEATILKNSVRLSESIKKEALSRRQMKNVVEANQCHGDICVTSVGSDGGE